MLFCVDLLCYLLSYVVIFHNVMLLCYVMVYYVKSCHVMSCHVMSCHVMSCHVMSCHVILSAMLCWIVLRCKALTEKLIDALMIYFGFLYLQYRV